jgi:hypothetical protein
VALELPIGVAGAGIRHVVITISAFPATSPTQLLSITRVDVPNRKLAGEVPV